MSTRHRLGSARPPGPSSPGARVPAPWSVAPGWAVASLVLSVAGLAVSGYLTVEHYSDQHTLMCQANAVVNCVKVTTSAYSQLFGVPVAVLGAGFYLVMTLACLPAGWRSRRAGLRWARLVAAGTGVLFVAYLVTAELGVIGAICEWCTAVHIITLGLCTTVLVINHRVEQRRGCHSAP